MTTLNSTISTTTVIRPGVEPDAEALRAIVAQRLARERGLSLPVAAVIAALAGIGPQDRRGRR